MIILPENSEDCFKRLIQESNSKKFHRSLEKIKIACDEIINLKGLLNYARIAHYTQVHFDGPKRQSIINNEKLKLYISIRQKEYAKNTTNETQSPRKKDQPEYPTNDLDIRTKSHIDSLCARNAFLEKAMSNLRRDILNQSRSNPIDLERSIEAGIQDDMSMVLVQTSQQKKSVEHEQLLVKIMQNLLEIAYDPASPLELKQRKGEEYIAIQTLGYTATLLLGREMRIIEKLKKEK